MSETSNVMPSYAIPRSVHRSRFAVVLADSVIAYHAFAKEKSGDGANFLSRR
jgi:hypothetical protein